MTGNIAVTGGNDNTRVVFKNCHPFTRSVIHLNDEHVATAENLDLTMNLYNLIEYSEYIPGAHKLWKNAKIAVPLKYISNFFRSLELPLINTKFYIELNWTKHSVMSNVDRATTFQITETELHVAVVTVNTDSNKKLSDLLQKELKRSVFWNEYKSKTQTETTRNSSKNVNLKCILLDVSYQGVNRLFLMGFNNANVQINSNQKYFFTKSRH